MIVVAAALFDGSGRVLLQRRRKESQHGGLWEFPGGKVEPDESPAAALVRELEEELGIAVAETALVPMGFATTASSAPRQVVLLLYRCEIWAGEVRNLDAEALAWAARAELASFAMPPLDVDLVRHAFGVTI